MKFVLTLNILSDKGSIGSSGKPWKSTQFQFHRVCVCMKAELRPALIDAVFFSINNGPIAVNFNLITI